MTNGTASTIASIFNSIATLGGSLGSWVGGHNKAVQQADEELTQLQSAISEGQWTEAADFARNLSNIQGLSTASMNGVRAIMTGSQNALRSQTALGLGANPEQVAIVNATHQQLLLMQINLLRTQMASESQGIFSHLRHLHSLATTGTTAV